MGFRFHRSFRIAPGVRLNLSKSGLGLSTGVRGYHVSHSADGRTRRTVSIPGTGMSWVTEAPAGTPRSHASPGTTTGIDASSVVTPAKPGLFAPAVEKALYQAIRDHDLAAVAAVATGVSPVAHAAALVQALLLLQNDEDDRAITVLQQLYSAGFDPATDPFLTTYVRMGVTVDVVAGAMTELSLDRDLIGLLLAELHQRNGDVTAAIATVEGLVPSTITVLSLAELDCEAGRFDDVISITEGSPNVDDATSLIWIFRGVAFREKGEYDAARACFAKVIRCRSRNPVVLHRARFERARCYESEGRTALARKDLATIRAEDADYEGLDAAIAQLDGPTTATPRAPDASESTAP